MSDSDSRNNAWLIPPSFYSKNRDAPFVLPLRPVSLYVAMHDGCRLAVDYYLPQASKNKCNSVESFPVVLILTPYYRRFSVANPSLGTEPTPNAAKYRDFFVPRGYALVVVDVRGTGASFGTRDGFRSPRERDDYREIVEWVSSKPWCNGAVGATGISYLGAACDFLASTGHPAVKAIAPISAVWDTYSDNYYPGGLFLNGLSETYDRLMTALDHDRRDLLHEFGYFRDRNYAGPQPVDDDISGQACRAAVREHLGNFRMSDFIREFACRDDALSYDPSFTSACFSPYHYSDGVRPEVAVLSISGWMDGAGYANGSISRFLTLDKNPGYLLLGPWDHGARTNTSPWRERVLPRFNILQEILRFFDHYLLGRDTGLQRESPVHYFSVHGERWYAAESWPPVKQQAMFHFNGGQRLSECSETVGAEDIEADFLFGSGNETRYERIGGHDCHNYYSDWSQRSQNLFSYTTDPMAADAELTGHPIVDLWLESSEPDATVIVYLTEIMDNGETHYVTEGLLRALHRRESPAPAGYKTSWPFRSFSRKEATPMPAGKPQRLRFAMLPVSWTFRRNSRIRLSIASADVDHVIHIPYGRSPRLRLWRGGRHTSRLELPLRFEP